MGKQRNPKGAGSYKKRKDGRYSWTQKKDGKARPPIYAKSLGALKKKVDKVADLPITNSNKLTVDAWFANWIEVYVKPLKRGGTPSWTEDMYKNASPIIGYMKLPNVIPADIQRVVAKMNTKILKPAVLDDNGKIIKPAKTGYSSKTMEETVGVLRRGFEQAKENGLIATNPVTKKIEIPQKQKKTRKVLSAKELHDLFEEMKNSRWIWAMKLLLVTGIRRGELLALRSSDIEIEHHRIVIDESNGLTGVGDTKNAKVHYVPLSKKAMEYLVEQRKMLEREFNPILFDEELKKTDLLFPGQDGTVILPNSFTKIVKRAALKAGINATPHCFRHTFVYLNRKALSLKDLQYILGHDESTTTLDIYGDIIDDSSEDTANVIDNIFDKMEEKLQTIAEEKNKTNGKSNVIQFRKRA
ncbi:site-specific integrase [Dehalobacter sp. DCM]|uniref:tyrosine-type recombinase/integrase n=1 Tax=Dehalobacter sp. DCM TaxID=2907827 RepID=UPI0030813868|nr:site-specific integrase [Dehalobacter sp. DCM]